MRDDLTLKETVLYGATMGFTFIYMLLKHSGVVIMTQYIVYVLVILGLCLTVCLVLNAKLNRVIKYYDKQAFMGVTHIRNRMEILDVVIALDILLDSIVEIPILFDPFRGPDNIFLSEFFWYFVFSIAMEVIGICLIGKYFKARKVIGQLENPLRAQNADPFAFLKDGGEAAGDTELMLSKLQKEELIQDQAEQEWSKCPVCGSENPSQLRQCVFCGGELGGGKADCDA